MISRSLKPYFLGNLNRSFSMRVLALFALSMAELGIIGKFVLFWSVRMVRALRKVRVVEVMMNREMVP